MARDTTTQLLLEGWTNYLTVPTSGLRLRGGGKGVEVFVLTPRGRERRTKRRRRSIWVWRKNKDGEELVDIGQFGSCKIHDGSTRSWAR